MKDNLRLGVEPDQTDCAKVFEPWTPRLLQCSRVLVRLIDVEFFLKQLTQVHHGSSQAPPRHLEPK